MVFEEVFDYVFLLMLGYLIVCLINFGIGMCVLVMMYLFVFVIFNQMEKVVCVVNQFGMVVCGLFGEGLDVSGSIFQIFNQIIFGEFEEEIIKCFGSVFNFIVEYE